MSAGSLIPRGQDFRAIVGWVHLEADSDMISMQETYLGEVSGPMLVGRVAGESGLQDSLRESLC